MDILKVRYRLFYQFSGREALTKEHLDLLPEDRRPSQVEFIVWCAIAIAIFCLGGWISLKHLLLFLGIVIIYHVKNVVQNLLK